MAHGSPWRREGANGHVTPRPVARTAALAGLLVGLVGCAELLGIEPFEERYRDAGTTGATGGTGGAGGSGADGGTTAGGNGGLSAYWSRRFGDADEDETDAFAVDGTGNVILGGRYDGTLTIDQVPLAGSGGGTNAFVAKLDPYGSPLWSRGLVGSGDDEVRDVAIDGQDGVIVAGNFTGTLDLGGDVLTAFGTGEDVFVARYGADGNRVWSRSFAASGDEKVFGVGWHTGSSSIVIGGEFTGALNISAPLTSEGGFDVFVAKLDDAGAPLWTKTFGGSASQGATALAVDASGNILVTGETSDVIDFGLGPIDYKANRDIFLAKLDADGTPLWSHGFGSTADEEPFALAVDEDGNVVICGYLEGAVDFGEGALVPVMGADVFVAKFDSAGNPVWSHGFGTTRDEACYSLAIDPAGNVLAAGRFDGGAPLEVGGGTLPCTGSGAIFLVRLSADTGAHLGSTCYGITGTNIPAGLAPTGANDMLLGGSLGGRADFGQGELSTSGGSDVFAAKVPLPGP